MVRMIRVKKIVLLPFISIIAVVGWLLAYFGDINFHSIHAGILTANEKIARLQKQLENAIIEEHEGIILGFLGIFALAPMILFGNFPSWAYVSAGIFSIIGSATLAHGIKHKMLLEKQLRVFGAELKF